ncbi:MAG: magnesium transporter [Candidatus Aenigmatarchaeota archaeon]|nr:MAG: magnesium transporter [Candidatus Aenigmarchaeota archaeon]
MGVSKSEFRIIEETLPIILLFLFVGLFTGGVLNGVIKDASMVPGILIIVPGMLGLRGNISSALGARLSSGLHLGYISTRKFSKGLKANIEISILMSLFISFVLSVLAWQTCIYLGGTCMGLTNFVLITVLTGLMSGVLMSFTTSGIAILSYRRGLDPDNTTLPAAASIGDIITIICLLISIRFVLVLGI